MSTTEKTEQEALRANFHDEASSRYDKILASERTVPWVEMRRYVEARVAGKEAFRPTARKLGDRLFPTA